MHPLLSQLSSLSAAAGTPLVGKDERMQHQHPFFTNDERGPRVIDTHASFQHIFEAVSNFKPAANPPDTVAEDAAQNADPSQDDMAIQANEKESEALGEPMKRADFPDEHLDQPLVDGTDTDPTFAILPGQQKLQSSTIREMAQVPYQTDESSHAINVSSGAEGTVSPVTVSALDDGGALQPHMAFRPADVADKSVQQTSEMKTATTGHPTIPHHFGWSDQSQPLLDTPHKIGSGPQPTLSGDLTQKIPHPTLGQKLEQPVPNLVNLSQTEQQAQTRSPQSAMTTPAEIQTVLVKKMENTPSKQLPPHEKFESSVKPSVDRPPLATINPTANRTLHNTPANIVPTRDALDTLMGTKAMLADAQTASSTEPAVSPITHHGSHPVRTDLPTNIARQLAEVVQHLPSRPVEITLSPEELGRVRLSVTSSDQGIVVNVLAERPETLDLMRRHINQLAQEFQSLGYKDIAFSFSSAEQNTSNEGGKNPSENRTQETSLDHNSDATETTHIHLSAGATTGLDLRL